MRQDAPVVIQAGGRGTRLHPYTRSLPKPLVSINGSSILELLIGQLADQGFRELHITLGYLGELIRRRCGPGDRWGVRIRYWPEEQPLGTIGPLRQVAGLNAPFLVLNADLVTDLHFGRFFEAHLRGGADLTLAVHATRVNVPLGVVTVGADGQVLSFVEKPAWECQCNMGVYGLNPSVLDLIPPNSLYGFDALIQDLFRCGGTAKAYPFAGYWLDVGRPEDLARAREHAGRDLSGSRKLSRQCA